MKKLNVEFQGQNFSSLLSLPSVNHAVQKMSWASFGGPDKAQINLSADPVGDDNQLWAVLGMLRSPVIIKDENYESRWWGYIRDVLIKAPAISIGVSLDGMFNRCSVYYVDDSIGTGSGSSVSTAWAEDVDSTQLYGKRELIETLSAANQVSAEKRRDLLISTYKFPVCVPRTERSSRLTVELVCSGWLDTFDWEYYSCLAGREANDASGGGSQDIGKEAASTAAAQSFQLASTVAWSASKVGARVKKVESPTDNFRISLHSDSADTPGTELAYATKAAADLTDSFSDVTLTLNVAVTLNPSTKYWVKFARSGSNNATDHYQMDVDEDLSYPRGTLKIYGGSSWAARDPDADARFSVTGVQDTTKQMETMVTNSAQFISELDLIEASGVSTNQFREGDQTCLTVLNELKKMGYSDGIGMTVKVNYDRSLRVQKESTIDEYLWTIDGSLVGYYNATTPTAVDPTGTWCRLKDIIPASIDAGMLGDPTRFFIDWAEYDPNTGLYKLTARGQPTPYDLPGIEPG